MSRSSDRIGTTEGEFSVAVFYTDDSHEYVRRWCGDEEAVKAFVHYCTSVSAKMGWTKEVRLTDGMDITNMHWTYEKGVIFPIEYAGHMKCGIAISPGKAD